MKNATCKKLRRARLTPIRYQTRGAHACFRHGWIVEKGDKGTMTIRLVGEGRNRRLSKADAKYVKEI